VQRFLAQIPRRLFLLVMLAGSAVVTASSLDYFDLRALPAFIAEKLPLRFPLLWLVSVRVHVAAACLSLPLCLALMTRPLQRRLAWHRWVGRVTGVTVLFALVPTGAVLAFDAKGGPLVTAGFLLSGGIVAWSMVRGVVAARRGEVREHSRAMRHVVAQMSVAVTSRASMIALYMAEVDPGVAYIAALWGPVVVSAAVAELVSPRSPTLLALEHLVERTRRALSPLDLARSPRLVARSAPRVGR
jgi:uncharacterized membrane protein